MFRHGFSCGIDWLILDVVPAIGWIHRIPSTIAFVKQLKVHRMLHMTIQELANLPHNSLGPCIADAYRLAHSHRIGLLHCFLHAGGKSTGSLLLVFARPALLGFHSETMLSSNLMAPIHTQELTPSLSIINQVLLLKFIQVILCGPRSSLNGAERISCPNWLQ